MWHYFNTGDQIWVEWRDGKWEVVRLLTHVSISWREGEPSISMLNGVEKFFHRMVVAWLKLVHRLL